MKRAGANAGKPRGDQKAPDIAEFCEYASGWYVLCRSRELGEKPIGVNIVGRELVVYRKSSGEIAVMDRRCSHLGADLASGTVQNDEIKCPFHGWKYGDNGECVSAHGCRMIPEFAKQKTYVAAERFGHIYFYNGQKPDFPLPFFIDESPDDFVWGRTFKFEAKSSWYMLTAHSFDVSHLYHVHDRKLTASPQIDLPAPYAMRNSYEAAIKGKSFRERLLRSIAGQRVKMTITVFGGSTVALAGSFRKIESHFLLNVTPRSEQLCEVMGQVFCRRSKIPLIGPQVDKLRLYAKYLFTKGYLAEEAAELGNPKYNQRHFVESDAEVIRYFNWLVKLPGLKKEVVPQKVTPRPPHSPLPL